MISILARGVNAKDFLSFFPTFFPAFFPGGGGGGGGSWTKREWNWVEIISPPPCSISLSSSKSVPHDSIGEIINFQHLVKLADYIMASFFVLFFFPGSYCRVEIIPSFSEDRGIRTPGRSGYAADEEVNLQYTRVLVRGSATFVNSHSIAPLTGF